MLINHMTIWCPRWCTIWLPCWCTMQCPCWCTIWCPHTIWWCTIHHTMPTPTPMHYKCQWWWTIPCPHHFTIWCQCRSMPMNHMMLTPMNHMTPTLMNHTITMRHMQQGTIQCPGWHHTNEPYTHANAPYNAHANKPWFTIAPYAPYNGCQCTIQWCQCTIQQMLMRTFLLPSAIFSTFLVVPLLKNTCRILYRLNPDSGGSKRTPQESTDMWTPHPQKYAIFPCLHRCDMSWTKQWRTHDSGIAKWKIK